MPGAVASPMVQKLPALRSGRFWPMPPRRPLVGGRVVLVASQGCEPRLRGRDRWATWPFRGHGNNLDRILTDNEMIAVH